jgi:hypothetical protein
MNCFLLPFAGAMMNEFEMRRKVRCHNGAVEIIVSGELLDRFVL